MKSNAYIKEGVLQNAIRRKKRQMASLAESFEYHAAKARHCSSIGTYQLGANAFADNYAERLRVVREELFSLEKELQALKRSARK